MAGRLAPPEKRRRVEVRKFTRFLRRSVRSVSGTRARQWCLIPLSGRFRLSRPGASILTMPPMKRVESMGSWVLALWRHRSLRRLPRSRSPAAPPANRRPTRSCRSPTYRQRVASTMGMVRPVAENRLVPTISLQGEERRPIGRCQLSVSSTPSSASIDDTEELGSKAMLKGIDGNGLAPGTDASGRS